MDYENDHKIEVMLSKKLVGKAPPDWTKEAWKRFYKSFNHAILTPRHLAAMIWQGYSFTPLYKNGRRKEENFVAAWHMAFDFDTDGASLDYLTEASSIPWMFASFAYSTPSSTKDHPKSRMVFVFDEPLESAELAREVYRAIAWQFQRQGSITDPSCKDPLRLYYGSPNCQVVTNWSYLKTRSHDERPSMIEFFIDEYNKAHPPAPEIQNPTIEKTKPDETYIERRVNALLDNVASAPDGEKHHVLNKNAFVMGGMVASGYISQGEAISYLQRAIRANGRAADLRAADATIETAVADGMAKPIIIEQTYKKDLDEIL